MNIHVNSIGLDGQIEENIGLGLCRNQLLVGLHHSLIEIGRFEVATIDKQKLLVRALLRCRGTTNETLNFDQRRVGRQLQKVVFHTLAHNIDYSTTKGRTFKIVDRSLIVEQLEGNLRVTQRNSLKLITNLARQRGTLLHKTATCRNIVEQIANKELRANRTTTRFLLIELTTIDKYLCSKLITLLAGLQLNLRNSRNRRQCLATKTERVQIVKIIDRHDFARRVAIECHTGVRRRHSATVINNLNQIAATINEINRYVLRPRINRILHHLLDNRRRSIDDLARCNLISNDFG